MIRKLIERRGILQAEPDFRYGIDKNDVLFYNFDRNTRLENLRAGEEWDVKLASTVIDINKRDTTGKNMFYRYVIPIRRIEHWKYYNGCFELMSGDVLIKKVNAIKRVDSYYADKSIVQEIGKWINPETKESAVMCQSIAEEDIHLLPKRIVAKIDEARTEEKELFVEV